MLPAYRYMEILYCFIVSWIDDYTIAFIVASNMAYVSPFQSSYLLFFCSYLILWTFIFVKDSLNSFLVLTSQVIYHLASQLLVNMWKHHVIAVLPEAFCFWFLTEKQQLKHPCLTDVQIVPFVDPWTMHRYLFRMHTAHLILINKVFLTTMLFDDSWFFAISSYIPSWHRSKACHWLSKFKS